MTSGIERIRQTSFADDSEDYKQFVDKFKKKKTTDDCYTPPEIYDVILDYVCKRYGVDRADVVRPFWPDEEFTQYDYPDGCVVVDNPPFSIISRIVEFYLLQGIEFFLFAPTLTLISSVTTATSCNHIACNTSITYENGAKVNTSFITSLDKDGTVLESGVELSELVNAKDAELQAKHKKNGAKYEYPMNVITASKCGWFAAHRTPYRLNAKDCVRISKIDAMGSRTIFGGGFLLSERAAAERAAAERAAAERAAAERFSLSERELEIVRMLGGCESESRMSEDRRCCSDRKVVAND